MSLHRTHPSSFVLSSSVLLLCSIQVTPLRLSYHGRNHYNSLVDPTLPPPLGELFTSRIRMHRQQVSGIVAGGGSVGSGSGSGSGGGGGGGGGSGGGERGGQQKTDGRGHKGPGSTGMFGRERRQT